MAALIVSWQDYILTHKWHESILTRWILIVGGILAGSAVIVGAFGAHALKGMLDPKALGWIETGVFYQMSHALAIIACGMIPSSRAINRTAIFFTFGTIFFSGSLYLMALTGITKLGIITPLGGVCFIAGWVSFCVAVVPSNNRD